MTEVTPDKAEPDKGIPTITVKPDPLTGQSKPATPATPEKASPKQPPQQQSSAPVPVKSGETGGKVVPDQKGDTQQSEPTNTSYAPPVNPHPYAWLKANDPEKAALVDEAVRLHGDGGNSVTADQLAAHWANESHFGYTSITSKDGAIGPLQILAATARQMDPHGQFDTTTVKGGLAVATLYLKHLAVDEHLGVNSVATNFAYMRGPVAAREAQADLQTAMQKYPVAFKGLQSFYPDMKLTSDQFPGSGNGSSYRDNWQQIAQQDTPDGVLHMIATTGPTGLGMTDRWMQVEGAMVAAAIAHGNYDAVQHVTGWVAQMSHAGALSNLALASSMMQSGNMEGAAGALAKAHAFFPDGTYAQFGTDAKGRLVGRQFSEKDGTPMGNAFLINNEQIMQQMLQLQNPRTYIQELQKYQKNNAEIDLAKSHAQYFRALPGLKEEAIQATRERDSARTDAQQARLDAQTQARRDKEQHDFDLQQQKQEGRVGNEDKVDTAVNTDYKERTTAARNAVTDAGDDAGKRAAAQAEVDRLGRKSQISRELRVQQMHGGYGMAGPAADALAEGVTKGKYDVRSIVAKDGTKYYGVYDKGADISKSQPHALLSRMVVQTDAGYGYARMNFNNDDSPMEVRCDDGPTGSARGQKQMAGHSSVFRVRTVRAGTRQPHPAHPGGEGGGGRRDCLGSRVGGQSEQSALLRAAGRDSDRPADGLRLALAGIPAGRRGGVRRGRSPGCEPLPYPDRLEHRHHHLCRSPGGQDRPSRPPRRRTGPVSALLVFAVGSATPGYGGRRVVDTLIGSTIAVLAVLVSPSAPTPERVVSDALVPVRHCRDALLDIGLAISSAWTLDQAELWRKDGLGLVQDTAKARRDHDGHRQTARWNARAHRQRLVLERADEALRVADKMAVQTRSIARALVDGAPAARPMPAVGAMLVSTASAIEAYAVWDRVSRRVGRPARALRCDSRCGRDVRRGGGPGMALARRSDSMVDFRDHPGHEPADSGRGQ